MLSGLMQDWPLTVDRFLDHAAHWHGDRAIVSRRDDGALDRTDYAALRRDAKRLSAALLAHGIVAGDRVATLAMNGAAHLTAWYAIAGIGAVCHTLNPRMGDASLGFVIAHAADRVILADGAFAPLLAPILPRCPGVELVVFLSSPAAAPDYRWATLADFVAGHDGEPAWGGFDEQTAAGLCYTSGTTGDPKGVLYSHRSNVLHTLITLQPDALGLRQRDVVMPVVPMYHANAWGLAFSAPAVGAKLVLPGAKLDGASLATLIAEEEVTFTAGVPTVWLGLLDHLEATGLRLPSLERVIVGGAALPAGVLDRFAALGVPAVHAWGMTELSPVGTVSTPLAGSAALPEAEARAQRLAQGRAPWGVELALFGDEGAALPHDGATMGALKVRGPAVARRYFRHEEDSLDAGGWFDTGDIATIDPRGFVAITDRAKDIVKSGGEWISSQAIESAATGHPAIAAAAVIGVPHPRWDERPLLFVTLKPGAPAPDDLLDHLARSLPRWWLPDRIETLDALPLGATGKVDKRALRALAAGGGELA